MKNHKLQNIQNPTQSRVVAFSVGFREQRERALTGKYKLKSYNRGFRKTYNVTGFRSENKFGGGFISKIETVKITYKNVHTHIHIL